MKKLLFIGIFGLSSSVFADGLYLGADLGYGFVDVDASGTAQYLANVSGETVRYKEDDGAILGRAFAGYSINENVAVELGYFRTGSLDVDFRSASGSANISAKTYGGDLSVLLRPSVSSGMNGLFLRLGGHYSKVDGDANASYDDGYSSATVSAKAWQSGTGLLAGFGYDVPLDKNMNARFSYTYMDRLGGISDANANVLTLGINGSF